MFQWFQKRHTISRHWDPSTLMFEPKSLLPKRLLLPSVFVGGKASSDSWRWQVTEYLLTEPETGRGRH